MPQRDENNRITDSELEEYYKDLLDKHKRKEYPPAPSQRFPGPDASSLETKQKTPSKPNIVPEKLGPSRRYYRERIKNIKGSDYSNEDPEVEDVTKLKNYEKLKDKLISELKKLDLSILLDELKIDKNKEIYKNILNNDINNYDKANIKLLENIKKFIENKKELDEI